MNPIKSFFRAIFHIKDKEVTPEVTTCPDDAYINSIYGAAPRPMEEEKKDKKEFYKSLVNGTYTEDKVTVGGVTHLKYSECEPNDLVGKGKSAMHKKCAKNFDEMKVAAKKEGVNLTVVSGYRSIEEQKRTFAKHFIDKKHPSEEEVKDRVKLSAPPGYSEHSTGLAIDINSTNRSFAMTKEYKWLQAHAGEYGFEMAYPENNEQGVAFEPWHWHYVGDEASKNIIARTNSPEAEPESI